MTSQIVSQEMIDAYYEYTRLTQDRSKFVSKLRAMAERDENPVALMAPGGWASMRTEAEAKRPQ